MSILLKSFCLVACALAICAKPQRNLNIQSRIAGPSTIASDGQYKFIVSLRASSGLLPIYSHTCGGSIVHQLYVLTAAHCLCNEYINQALNLVPVLPGVTTILNRIICTLVDPIRLRAYVGSIHRTTGGTEIRVANVFQHENYDSGTIVNDVGLVKLTAPTTYQPIVLPLSATIDNGDELTVIGWGLLSGTDSTLPPDLRVALVHAMDTNICRAEIDAAISGAVVSSDANVCTSGQDPSPCPGDSGGPLFKAGGSAVAQVGIVSWGISNGVSYCYNGYPNVYTFTPYHCSWIQSKTSSNVTCVSV